MKISVVIVTHDSALHLQQVLECVREFDELLVVDMDSTDHTLDIARNFGCKIIPYEGEAGDTVEDARNFALEHAKYEWVLMVEPNELFPERLRRYIRDFVKSNEADVLLIPRKNFLMYRFRKGAYPDYRPRLFRRRLVKWTPNSGNLPEIEGKPHTIPAAREDLAIIHLSTGFIPHKGLHFRTGEEEIADGRVGKVSLASMMIGPFMTFMRTYLGKGNLLYGKDGFVFACRTASDHFNTLARTHETMRIHRFNADHEEAGIKLPLPSDHKNKGHRQK